MGEKVSDVADKVNEWLRMQTSCSHVLIGTQSLHQVNKGLGKGLASAIDKGEEATKKAKGTMESMKGEAKAGANKAGSEMERTGSKVCLSGRANPVTALTNSLGCR